MTVERLIELLEEQDPQAPALIKEHGGNVHCPTCYLVLVYVSGKGWVHRHDGTPYTYHEVHRHDC